MTDSRTIDLRSDTVTRPTDAMRAAMASADVGDDVYGEDPTVDRLERRVAELLGTEAALFVPSGTMANQLALVILTERGDEVLASDGAHVANYESGAASVLAQVQITPLGRDGLFVSDDIAPAVRPVADWYPRTRVVAVENTHNRGGGRVVSQQVTAAIVAESRALGLRLHLDGARLWNASVATGASVGALARGFDTVSVCLSKGLAAPVGSLLASDRARIAEARRWRKRIGGGMRQTGMLAAAGLFALDHHRERLADDHAHARALYDGLRALCAESTPVPETNIVMLDLAGSRSADDVVRALEAHGVRVSAFGPRRIRAVTHLDVSHDAIGRAVATIAEVLQR